MLRRMKLKCVGVWTSAARPCNMPVQLTVRTLDSDLRTIRLALDLPKRHCCVSQGASVYISIVKAAGCCLVEYTAS
jgi:hypothetical protein